MDYHWETAFAGPNTFQDHLTITAPHLKTINNRHLPFSKMVTNTTRDLQDTIQRCCSNCNKVHVNTSHRNTRKNRALHHRSDRQSPTNLNSPRCHCKDIHSTASTTSGPSDVTKINTRLQHDTASNTFHQQVSHLTTHNAISSLETHLITDTAVDGQTEFHTTLQIVTSQGCKPLHVKVDPGATGTIMPLSKTLYQIWCFEENCLKTYVCNMVSPRWKTQELFRIHSAKCSTQDPSPNPTNQILCFWILYKSNHHIIICSIIQARHSAIHSPKQNTCQLPIKDQCHYPQ